MIHGSDLTILHAELLALTLRHGKPRDDRIELANVVVEWQAPFALGALYEPERERLDMYAQGRGTGEAQYVSRFNAEGNQRYSAEKRRNWYPIWSPGDELAEDDAPCLVGVALWQDGVTGVFRAHNFASAWPDNLYLLKCFHEQRAGTAPESVVCHSIQGGIRVEALDAARKIASDYAYSDKPIISDAAGSWSVSAHDGVITAQHMIDGVVAEEFSARQEHALRLKITRAGAWPEDRSECAWLGAEIAKRT